MYDLEPIRRCFLNDDLKLDEQEAHRNRPVYLPQGGPRAFLLTVGGAEGPEYLRQSEDLTAAWRRHGTDVEVRVLFGQHHFSFVVQSAEPEVERSRLILGQMGMSAG